MNMRILEVCVDLDGGGIERYLYNYCSRIKDVQFDFAVVDNKKDGILETEFLALGYGIYRVPRISDGIRNNYQALKEIMTKNQYDAVHVHLGYKGFVALRCAKKCGIKTRIVHAHIANVPESKKERAVRRIFTMITKLYATHLAACGIDAAKWVWGDKAYENNKIVVHNNAIETNKYEYSLGHAERYRRELNIGDDTLVVGHVGRLSDQKNQLRLLDIYQEIYHAHSNSCLLLIGRGEQEDDVRSKIERLGLSDHVKLLGVRNDVPALLSVMNVFVFPSKYEGLPFTLIETQCNGLYAISSDVVTPQVKVSDCIKFLSLDDSNAIWCQEAIQAATLNHDSHAKDEVVAAGYDINVEADKLKKYYIKLIQERKKL